jgi:uncharacterized SAM-binding protein YcdF (DUF218 family)
VKGPQVLLGIVKGPQVLLGIVKGPKLRYHVGVLAVCVLGCRTGSKALERRARTGARAFFARRAEIVMACGGRAWDGVVEADAIADVLEGCGVPKDAIVRERISLDTYENACNAAQLLKGQRDVIVVTCSWHLRRATMLFEKAGLRVVEGVGAEPEGAGMAARIYWRARERVAGWKDRRR